MPNWFSSIHDAIFSETDPDFDAWVAANDHHENWDTAYGWGDHANAGYLTGIPQLSADPSSPSAEDVWVLATISGGSGGGELVMLFGAMPITVPNSGGSQTYQLSYRTSEGTTKRVSLT